jgi:DNA-binding beta-propeller fold protein YncE
MWKPGAVFSSLLLSGTFVVHATPASELLILTVSPPEIVTVDSSNWKLAGRIPLPAVPAGIAVLPGGQFLYVLVNGATGADGSLAKGPSEVVVFDRVSHKIIERLEVGWGASRMATTGDGNFVASFRERSPSRDFERAPSIAVGVNSLAKQAKLAGKPSTISLINAHTHKLVWRKELDRGDQNVLYSPAAGRFCVPNPRDEIKIIDMQGTVRQVALPKPKGKRQVTLSPGGRWLYVVENGKDSTEKLERVNGRIFVIDTQDPRVARTFEVEHESLTPVEGASRDGIAVANRSGAIRSFTGAEMRWRIEAGRDFRFTRWMDEEGGLLIAGKTLLRFVQGDEVKPSWSLDWHAKLGGEPGWEIVRIPDSSMIAVPVMAVYRGEYLDRVVLVDLQAQRVFDGVPVGRRGRMTAKTIGILAAGAASSSSTWSNAFPGPNSFNWNGFAIDMARVMGDAFRLLVAGNPSLKISPDGKFAYAMSSFGNDVTIIQIQDRTVAAKIGVGGDSQGLVRANRGTLLCAWAGKRLTWISTATNEVQSTQRPCHGRFARVQIEPEQRWIVTFSDRCAVFWDVMTGDRLAGIEKLGKPRLVLSQAGAMSR